LLAGMAYNVHSSVTTGADVASVLVSHVNGVVKEVRDVKGPPTSLDRPVKRKPRSKYKHIAALHTKAQPSCLSHEAEALPSFLGFRNLMVLTISMPGGSS